MWRKPAAVDGVDALEHAPGRARARFKLTPEMIERACAQIRGGDGVPLKDLRDELRSRVRTCRLA